MLSLQLYDKLLELPLFQGMSKDNLATIVSQTKFDFIKLRTGEKIAKAGDVCDPLYFLISGTLEVESRADDYNYTFLEEITAPQTIQIECVFGLTPRYTRTFRAKGVCNLISLDKSELVKLLDSFLIFRINFLNALSTQAQKNSRLPWKHCPEDLRGHITQFFASHCLYPAGKKTVIIKMARLADELNGRRLDISKVLNEMQEDGLLLLHRGRIIIPALEKLR